MSASNIRFLRADPATRNAEHHVTRDEIRAAIITIYGEAGAWVCNEFESHSARYFGGQLELRPILFGLTPHGHALGYYTVGNPQFAGHVTLHTSLLMPRGRAWGISKKLGVRFTSDVVLHEMVHAYVYEVREEHPRDSHNNPFWCAEVERITPMLGLPAIKAKPIKQKRVDGKVKWFTEPGHLSREDFAHWPHSIRPEGYYEAAAYEVIA